MEFTNRIAIVTGGTKGIGRAVAHELLKSGVRVCVVARHEEGISRLIEDFAQFDRERLVGFVCDVSDSEDVAALFEFVDTELGEPDILINNAGVGIFGKTVEEMTPDEFKSIIGTNLCGVFYCCHEAIARMRRKGGGYIINISSLAGTNAHPKMAAYNASKFGLNGFSESLMQEVRHLGIKVSYIMPGSVNTEFGGDAPSAAKSWQLQPEDIALAVMDLLHHNPRSLPSRIEIRPSQPPQK